MSKTVLITGASRGIGFETAKRLITEESNVSKVILLARESEVFNNALVELNKLNLRKVCISSVYLDVGDLEILKDKIKQIKYEHGNIDILICNAGYTNPVPVQQIDFQDFEKTMAVNLYSPFITVQELLKVGNTFSVIVNIASTAGIKGRSGWLTYSASKAALINMSEVLREELAIYGTRVVCISPGRTATSLRKILAPDEDPKTIMQPENVAEVIEMLVSSTGQFIDSENLVIRL